MPNNQSAIRSLPGAVTSGIKHLGHYISVARRRRQQTQVELATRMNVDVRTLRRLEDGDPGVALGVYVCALWALGLLKKLNDLTDPKNDEVGHSIALHELPKRVRRAGPEF